MADLPTGNDAKGPADWWRTLPGILTATAAIITAVTGLVVAAHQAGLFDREPAVAVQAEAAGPDGPATVDEPGAPTEPSTAPSTSTERADRGALQPASVHFDQTEVTVGPVVYTILGAEVDRASEDRLALRLTVRFTNVGAQYGVLVSDGSFRLLADGVPLAPDVYPSEAVYLQSAKEGTVAFTFADTAREVLLQLGEVGGEVRRVPVSLTGETHEQAATSGPRQSGRN